MASEFGPLIPLELARAIIQEAADQSAVLRLGTVQRMSSGQTQIPVLSALPQAAFIAATGAAKPATEISWTSSLITAEEVAATLPVPNNYLDDSRFNLWGEIRPRLAEAIAKCVDEAIVVGLGAPASFPVGGIMALAAPPVVSDEDTNIVDAISAAMEFVEGSGLDVNGFLGRTSVKGALRGVKTSTGEWLVIPPSGANALGTLWGEPMAYTKIGFGAAANPDLIAGDWTKLVIGLREDLRFDISTDGVLRNPATGAVTVSAFQDDVSIMRVYMRLGYVVGRPVVNRPDGTQGAGSPFKSVRKPAAAVSAEYENVETGGDDDELAGAGQGPGAARARKG